jgi:SP family general alpha glucoside:H+ symporter-like MFS transporter
VCYILVLFLGTWPADKFGRKPMILLIQVFMAIACLIEMFATHWTHWLAAKMMNVSRYCPGIYRARLIPQGFSVGINQAMLMTYISEIAPSQGRESNTVEGRG